MREVLASIREFGGKVARRWYVAGIGVIGGILGVVDAVAVAAAKPKATPFSIPLWVWLPLLAGGFLVAIIWAFHDVRLERDAALTGVKDRFETLRYALALGGFGAHISRNADGETWDVAVWVVVTNSSAEPLRCDAEELTATIQGQRSEEEAESPVVGVVVQPDGSTTVLSGFVRGVVLPWQEASLQFTALYGHPAGGPRYRKSQGYRLLTFPANRLFWKNAADIGLGAVLTSNPEVQDASPV
jgi:hypothetical protein